MKNLLALINELETKLPLIEQKKESVSQVFAVAGVHKKYHAAVECCEWAKQQGKTPTARTLVKPRHSAFLHAESGKTDLV